MLGDPTLTTVEDGLNLQRDLAKALGDQVSWGVRVRNEVLEYRLKGGVPLELEVDTIVMPPLGIENDDPGGNISTIGGAVMLSAVSEWIKNSECVTPRVIIPADPNTDLYHQYLLQQLYGNGNYSQYLTVINGNRHSSGIKDAFGTLSLLADSIAPQQRALYVLSAPLRPKVELMVSKMNLEEKVATISADALMLMLNPDLYSQMVFTSMPSGRKELQISYINEMQQLEKKARDINRVVSIFSGPMASHVFP